MADKADLKSAAEWRAGSSPATGTKKETAHAAVSFLVCAIGRDLTSVRKTMRCIVFQRGALRAGADAQCGAQAGDADGRPQRNPANRKEFFSEGLCVI